MTGPGTREIIIRTLESDVAALLNHGSLSDQRKIVRVAGGAQPTAQQPVEPAVGAPTAPKKNNPALLAVVVVIALGAIGLAGYLLYSNLTTPLE